MIVIYLIKKRLRKIPQIIVYYSISIILLLFVIVDSMYRDNSAEQVLL